MGPHSQNKATDSLPRSLVIGPGPPPPPSSHPPVFAPECRPQRPTVVDMPGTSLQVRWPNRTQSTARDHSPERPANAGIVGLLLVMRPSQRVLTEFAGHWAPPSAAASVTRNGVPRMARLITETPSPSLVDAVSVSTGHVCCWSVGLDEWLSGVVTCCEDNRCGLEWSVHWGRSGEMRSVNK